MTGFGTPCGACKFLRRKCVKGCIFAAYFSHEQGATHFAAIHKVFGASNVSKLLGQIPISDRPEAAVAITYEAQARIRDPIYGCVAQIFALQEEVANLQAQIVSLKTQVTQGLVNNFTPNNQDSFSYSKGLAFNSHDQSIMDNLEALRMAQSLSKAKESCGSYYNIQTGPTSDMESFSTSMNGEAFQYCEIMQIGTTEMDGWGELQHCLPI